MSDNEKDHNAGLIHQPIPDMAGTEPRLNKARVVHTMEMDGTITRELFGEIEQCYEVLRWIEGVGRGRSPQ